MRYSEGVNTILNWSKLWGKTNGNSWKEAKIQTNKQTNAGESGSKNEKEAEKNWHRKQLRKVFYLSGSDLRCNRLDSNTCNRWPGLHRSLRSDKDCCNTRRCLWG